MSRTAMISTTRLTAGYQDHMAVADVSFDLLRGEILCLVGESGCGKSTVLKALAASPEIRVESGEIRLEDRNLAELSPKERRALCGEKIGMVFQSPGASFNPIRTYGKQFKETLKSHGKYHADTFEKQAAEAFAKVELKEGNRILRQCPYELSGGMNQRAALALAMLLGQDILLCDEPTSALDATIQLQVARELKKLRDENGITMMIVTHNLALARFLADRIGVMYAGRLVELGGTEDVLSRPQHPYTKSLMEAIPGLDGRMPNGLPGSPPMTGPAGTGCGFADRCPCVLENCRDRNYELQPIGEGHYTSCCHSGPAGVSDHDRGYGGM